MNYLHPELIEKLAAEYVLGTLQGAARRRFERLLKEHAMMRQRTQAWQAHLHPLAQSLAPVQPPARAWQGIRQRLKLEPKPASGWWQSLMFWRLTSLLGTAAAVLMGVFLLLQHPPAEAPGTLVSVLSNTQAEPMLLARLDAGRAELHLASVGTLAAPAGRDYQLWALPPGAAPVSLGVMQRNGEQVVHLSARDLAELRRSHALAVSLEPQGGSPTGAPTGPVLMNGKLRLS